jgi:UDP-N-acetylglucosamine diphosphorylase/glucosamine-1-phosphate N-acetyltransferase
MTKSIEHIILFEDDRVDRLFPLTLVRPAWELLCGTETLLGRIRKVYPDSELGFWVRESLAEYIKEGFPGIPINQSLQGDAVLVNGRMVDVAVLSNIPPSGNALFHDGVPMVGKVETGKALKLFQRGGTAAVIQGLKKSGEISDSAVINYPWDLVERNETQIMLDTSFHENESGKGNDSKGFDFFGEADPRSVIQGIENVQCGVGTNIGPFSVINATTGPVVIGKNVTIESHTMLQGPLFIDDDVVVRSFARIRGGSSIGRGCKVAEEISKSIIHPFTNKQHEGFLGHSVIGSWCNLGAGTTTSNLRNDYAPIKVQVGNGLVETGGLFFGSVIGDHTATAIGTTLNTGTVIGIGSNVVGAGFPPRYIPSFHWGGSGNLKRQSFEVIIFTIRTMMARRNQPLTDAYHQLLEQVYHTTAEDHPLSSS